MRKVNSCLRNLAVLCLATALVGGCVVYPEGDGYSGYYVGGVVAIPPPAPLVEAYGRPPGPGYFWIGGYWNWVGGRHVWVRGHWAHVRRGYRWVRRRWVHRRDGWHLIGGRWERR